ncbi:DUF955 domain-containing protein [Ectobacillus polymachus]|uniref:DUF955 domain-containing protein n=1 Tax=Ectobacillus polymachus TaxID=1508806 RepID=UPI003A8A263A
MAYLNVCISIAPGAQAGNDRIRQDILLSHDIWHPISFRIKSILTLDQSFAFHDREISYKIPFKQQKKVYRLLEYCKMSSPDANLYIIYVNGNYFTEQHVIGCAYTEITGSHWKGFILVTNTAASSSNLLTVPHEIGHILLTRRKNGELTNEDPHSYTGSPHHSNPRNLMYPVIPRLEHTKQLQHLITEKQRRIALQSPMLYSTWRS